MEESKKDRLEEARKLAEELLELTKRLPFPSPEVDRVAADFMAEVLRLRVEKRRAETAAFFQELGGSEDGQEAE